MPFTDAEKKERRKEARKRYQEKHREHLAAKSRAWYQEHKNDPGVKARYAASGKKWREENPERYAAYRKKYRQERKQDPRYHALEAAKHNVGRRRRRDALSAVVSQAKTAGCACGEREPICLDFHHRDPATKKFNISAVRVVLPTLVRLNEELAKCDLVCGNCHWKQHQGQFSRRSSDLSHPDRLRGIKRRQQREERWAHAIARAKAAGCTLCSEDNHFCLQFHHVDPTAKLFYVGSYRSTPLRHDIWLEVLKTMVLCVNCHRRVHAGIATLPQVALEDYWRERLAA